MNDSEKLCLKWNDFKENTISSFGILREDKELSDVTLACEDGQQVEAHKVVLASSSPFFLNILKRNKHPHPLIYMRGLKSEDLVAIMDFLYYGEANVYQDNLDSFLGIAEELRLKGLTGSDDVGKDQTKEPPKAANHPFSNNTILKKESFPSKLNTESDSFSDSTIALGNDRTIVDLQDLDEQIRSMMTKSMTSQGTISTCNVCGIQRPPKDMPRHIEANHITGVSHACDVCGKVSRSRNALGTHKLTYHVNKAPH